MGETENDPFVVDIFTRSSPRIKVVYSRRGLVRVCLQVINPRDWSKAFTVSPAICTDLVIIARHLEQPSVRCWSKISEFQYLCFHRVTTVFWKHFRPSVYIYEIRINYRLRNSLVFMMAAMFNV